jgi:hypothetical protein
MESRRSLDGVYGRLRDAPLDGRQLGDDLSSEMTAILTRLSASITFPLSQPPDYGAGRAVAPVYAWWQSSFGGNISA